MYVLRRFLGHTHISADCSDSINRGFVSTSGGKSTCPRDAHSKDVGAQTRSGRWYLRAHRRHSRTLADFSGV